MEKGQDVFAVRGQCFQGTSPSCVSGLIWRTIPNVVFNDIPLIFLKLIDDNNEKLKKYLIYET